MAFGCKLDLQQGKKLSKALAVSALSIGASAALFTSSAMAADIKSIDHIAPAYREAAPSLMQNYTDLDEIKKINKAMKADFGNFKPEIFTVKNEFDGFDVEVAFYKPQGCAENAEKCPVFEEGAVRQDRRMDRPLVLFSYAGGFLVRHPYYNAAHYQMIANTLNAYVAVPKYRLSHEKAFPAALQDNYSVLSYLYQNADKYRINTDAIVLMGESAGGGLTAGLSLFNRDHYDFPIAAQVLIYPMLDYRTGTEQGAKLSEKSGEISWNAQSNSFAWKLYGDPEKVAQMGPDPRKKMIQHTDYLGYYSPAAAKDLSRLPPTFIYVGDLDLFANESLEFASKLVQSGDEVEFHMENGVYHIFDVVKPDSEETQKYYKSLFSFLANRMYGAH